MKKIYLKLCVMFLFCSCTSAQEISKNEYSNKIMGRWIQLTFNAELGEYSRSQTVYNFKTNKTLEILENNVAKGTYTYEIILTNNYQNIFVSTQANKQLAILKLVDKEDNDYVDIYSMKMLFNDVNKLVLGLEFPGRTYNNMTLEKE